MNPAGLAQPNHRVDNQMPEIRKYKKNFKSDINSASLWGVNLLIGTKAWFMLNSVDRLLGDFRTLFEPLLGWPDAAR